MPPLTLAGAFTAWQFAPLVSGVLVLLAAAYLVGAWLVAHRHRARPWPARRTLTFLLGLAVVLAVSMVRAHGMSRSDTRDDLATYNAYLARLDS